jgi:Undecaprenyl-phosphate glucose phosphotransferase
MPPTRRSDLLLPLLTVLVDALAIEVAFLLAYWLRFETELFQAFGFLREDAPPFSVYLIGSAAVTTLWLLLFQTRGMYGVRRNVNLSDELINTFKVISLGMIIVMSIAFLYREYSYSRIVFALLWVFATGLVFTGRTIIRALEQRTYRHGRELQRAIIVGNDDLADQVFSRLHRHVSFGIDVIGYFADRPADERLALRSAPYLGPASEVPAFVRAESVDLGFLALRSSDHATLFDLVAECEGVNIEFMLVPDLLEVLTSRVQIRDLEGIPFLTLKKIPLTTWGRITKRAFDVTLSAVGLVGLFPLFGVIAAAIRIDSRGPVLFKQKRVGLDGKEFTMYKFRSMVAGAERHDVEAGLGIRHDPRRTRVGLFLRKSSLDELPQLWNVLRGDMSLVGPRPERAHVVHSLKGNVPKYMDRHRMKAGVTGWAQVNGLRGDTSIEERIKYDLYYIENWSLAFDIRILVRTVRAAIAFREVH